MSKIFNFGKYKDVEASIVAKYDPYYITWGLENITNEMYNRCNFSECKEEFMRTYNEDKTIEECNEEINRDYINKCFLIRYKYDDYIIKFLKIDDDYRTVEGICLKKYGLEFIRINFEMFLKFISNIKEEIIEDEFNNKIEEIYNYINNIKYNYEKE